MDFDGEADEALADRPPVASAPTPMLSSAISVASV